MSKPDLYAVLDHYGWEPPSPRSGWVSMRCKAHGDTRPSCRVNFDEGRMRCMACGFGGDSYDVIQHEEGVSFGTAKRLGTRMFGAGDEPVSARPGGVSGRGSPGGSRYRLADSAYVPPRLRGLSHSG